MHILVLSGPNLNLLGTREPEIYGHTTLAQIHERLTIRAAELKCTIDTVQSNHEGVLIETLHSGIGNVDGVILNPGGFTHTSVALRDAVALVPFPVIEVHISNVHGREEFRRHSYISPVARGVIVGLGWRGYLLALEALVAMIREEK